MMKAFFKALTVMASAAFVAPALSSTPEDQAVRGIVQGVYIERDHDVTTTYRIAHHDGALAIAAGDYALPGVELYSVSPADNTVNFWVEEDGERGLATMESLRNIGVLRLTMPSGERHSMDHVRQMTDHDYRALFRAAIRDQVDASLLDDYEHLVFEEGLALGEAYLQLEAKLQPSFDCSVDLTDVEQMICRSNELSGLDMEMSKTYQKAMSEGFADEKVDISSDQMEWLGRRNQCSDVDCLRDAYYDRLDTLEGFLHSITRTPGGMKMD
ncbi:lysozyme inhibitor LprI family protein [Vreelandella zhanjiangensis]|uniref:lysozyme inhibitor LprI family protein n=1 Tax=Vreelandella zhanjiangensis TaxID=1121960 RepID=UPI00402AE5A0